MQHIETKADGDNSKGEVEVGDGLNVKLPDLPDPKDWMVTRELEVMQVKDYLKRHNVNGRSTFGVYLILDNNTLPSRGEAEQAAINRLNNTITDLSSKLAQARYKKTRLLAQARLTKKLTDKKK